MSLRLLYLIFARGLRLGSPTCGTVSSRVHNRYARRLADSAIGGRQVEIRLAVRRLEARLTAASARHLPEQATV